MKHLNSWCFCIIPWRLLQEKYCIVPPFWESFVSISTRGARRRRLLNAGEDSEGRERLWFVDCDEGGLICDRKSFWCGSEIFVASVFIEPPDCACSFKIVIRPWNRSLNGTSMCPSWMPSAKCQVQYKDPNGRSTWRRWLINIRIRQRSRGIARIRAWMSRKRSHGCVDWEKWCGCRRIGMNKRRGWRGRRRRC